MDLLEYLRYKLVVSCQAEKGFPLNRPDRLAAMAATVVRGGADAIRASEPDNIRAIKQAVAKLEIRAGGSATGSHAGAGWRCRWSRSFACTS